jgi:hypothetical protein
LAAQADAAGDDADADISDEADYEQAWENERDRLQREYQRLELEIESELLLQAPAVLSAASTTTAQGAR